MYESQGLLYSAPDEKTSSRSAVGPWNSTQIIDSERELSALLADIQDLEKRQGRSSRFRLLCRRLEPLVKFLAMYAPAVDMLVQFDVQPSALIWGSLRAILNVR